MNDRKLLFGFGVSGKPQPAGSKRAFPFVRPGRKPFSKGWLGVRVSDDNPKAAAWKNAIARIAAKRFGQKPLTGPLGVKFVFRLARPKSHYRSGKNGHLLRDSAPKYPEVKPDALKLARAVEDALTGVVWVDDAQIVEELLQKRYASGDEPEAVFVSVYAMDADLF